MMDEAMPMKNDVEPHWYGLYTRSNCENLVSNQLRARWFTVFFPKVDIISSRAGVKRLIQVPMFPSYLFLHTAMDKAAFLEVQKTHGLVRIIGGLWDQLSPIPEKEILAIRKISEAHFAVSRHPYLCQGDRVCIVSGPLEGVEGIYLKQKRQKGFLIISIELFQQSVTVEIDRTSVISL